MLIVPTLLVLALILEPIAPTKIVLAPTHLLLNRSVLSSQSPLLPAQSLISQQVQTILLCLVPFFAKTFQIIILLLLGLVSYLVDFLTSAL